MTARFFRSGEAHPSAPRRFALVGLTATVVDYGLAVGLTEAGVTRAVADIAALVIAALVSWTLHSNVTLRGDQLDRWIRQPPVFFSVALLAGIVDLAVYLSLGSSSPAVAKAVALATAAVLRVVAHRLVLFRAVRREQDQPSRRPQSAGAARLTVVVPAFREAERIGVGNGALAAAQSTISLVSDLVMPIVFTRLYAACMRGTTGGGAAASAGGKSPAPPRVDCRVLFYGVAVAHALVGELVVPWAYGRGESGARSTPT